MDATSSRTRQPGTDGLWTFVFIDMCVFFLFFIIYVTERHRLPDIFLTSQHLLNPFVGLTSTLALLTSSWCVAEAVRMTRRSSPLIAARWLNGALLLGLVFIANKMVEYGGKFEAGITPVTNGFFTFYFLITGIHFLHVLGGMVFITHCRSRIANEARYPLFLTKLENVGLFWHFVDVLWLFIFPMIYLTELVG